MLRVRGRARVVAVASLLVMFTAGCGLINKNPVTAGPSTAASPATAATPSPTPAELPVKAAVVTYDLPAGFKEENPAMYRILVPLQTVYTSKWLAPQTPVTGNIVAVVSYLLDEDVTNATEQDLRGRVQRYAAKVKAVSTTDPVKSTVGGHTALTQDIEQPGTTTATVKYQSVFVFAGPYLVQLICQYTTQKDAILKACGSVRDSLKIAAA